MSGRSLSEGRCDLPEAGQANGHRLRADVESLREPSDRLFNIRILPELVETRPQESLWHQQGGSELVRLDLMGIACAAGLGVPEGHKGVLIGFSVDLGLQRMRELIQTSPSAPLLLPLTTALERELGYEPRVAREVDEVAQDIQQTLKANLTDMKTLPDLELKKLATTPGPRQHLAFDELARRIRDTPSSWSPEEGP